VQLATCTYIKTCLRLRYSVSFRKFATELLLSLLLKVIVRRFGEMIPPACSVHGAHGKPYYSSTEPSIRRCGLGQSHPFREGGTPADGSRSTTNCRSRDSDETETLRDTYGGVGGGQRADCTGKPRIKRREMEARIGGSR
jgi:hypothetical protein